MLHWRRDGPLKIFVHEVPIVINSYSKNGDSTGNYRLLSAVYAK